MQIIQKQLVAIFLLNVTVIYAQFALPAFQASHKPHNYVIDMDGSNDYVLISNNSNFEPTDFTVMAWVNLDVYQAEDYFVYRHKTWFIGFSRSGTKFEGGVRDNSGDWLYPKSSTTPSVGGGWYQVVLTFDNGSTDYAKLYINGSSEDSESSSNHTLNSQSTEVAIGAKYNSGSSNHYNGQIDEVSFWNEALTANEITALYNSGSPLDASSNSGNYTSSSGLVSYYKFNKNANSESGSYNGSASGGPTYVDMFIP